MATPVMEPGPEPPRLRRMGLWLTAAGAALVAAGYGVLAIVNLEIANLYRTGSLGDIVGPYQLGAVGDALVGTGLFLAIVGLTILVRR